MKEPWTHFLCGICLVIVTTAFIPTLLTILCESGMLKFVATGLGGRYNLARALK